MNTNRDSKYGKLHQAGRKPNGATTTITHGGKTYRVPVAAAGKLRTKLRDAERGHHAAAKRGGEESVPNQWARNPMRWEDKR